MTKMPGPKPDHTKTRQPFYISPKEAADQLGVSVITIRRAIRDGKLTAYRIGKRTIRVDQAELLNLLRRIPSAKVGDVD